MKTAKLRKFESVQGIIPSKAFLLSALTILPMTGCSKKKDSDASYNFGAPRVSDIVRATAPAGLTGGSSLAESCSTFNPSASANEAYLFSKYRDYLACATFQQSSKVEATSFYRYWVDVLDTSMGQTNARLSAKAESLPICVSATPTSTSFKINVETSSASEAATIDMKFNCFETLKSGTSSQTMAFGKDSDYYYLMFITKDADSLTKTGQGFRVMIAKVTTDSNQADIWFIGNSYQSSPVMPRPDNISTVFNRVIANKSTGEFTYSKTETLTGMAIQSSFIRSNGTNLFVKGQSYVASLGLTNVRSDSDPSKTTFCVDAKTLDEVSASVCTNASLNTVPTAYGLTDSPVAKSSATFFGELKTNIDDIMKTDFASLGVGSM